MGSPPFNFKCFLWTSKENEQGYLTAAGSPPLNIRCLS